MASNVVARSGDEDRIDRAGCDNPTDVPRRAEVSTALDLRRGEDDLD